jgi:hypothetical protein
VPMLSSSVVCLPWLLAKDSARDSLNMPVAAAGLLSLPSY